MIRIRESIKNIRSSCKNYADPDLVATVIHDNLYMGTSNIAEFCEYGIDVNDTFEEKILKILKYENIFLNLGMYVFIPIINECDIYSTEDFSLKLTQEEFDKYANEKERVFGILIKKNTTNYIIGSCDLCGCSIDAAFKEIEESDLDFYKKIEEIVNSRIIC